MKRWVALAFVGSTLTLSCADDTSVGGNVDTETGTGSSTGMSAGPSPDGGPGPDDTAADATAGESTTAATGESSSTGDPTLDGTSSSSASSSDTGEIVCRGDGECDDDNPCTADECVDTACQNDDEPDGTACNDGLMDGVCEAGQCVPAAECKSPADCVDLPPDDDCQTRTCENGMCGQTFAAAGTPASAVRQTAGDCQVVQCDGAGGTMSADDDLDVPDDGMECTEDVCTAGVPSNPLAAEGTACAAGVCDDAGTCVGCLAPEDCAGEDTFCQVRTCVDNVCGVDNTAADTPLPDPDQTANDCQLAVCDGAGNVAQNADDGDVPVDDGNDCTGEACNMGVPLFPDEPVDTACDDGGGFFCDGAGACVECNDATQCSGAGQCGVDACTDNACTVDPAAAGTACDDGLFCTATDECDGTGACAGTGDPCEGPDGDIDCMESCVEGVGGAGACNGPDTAGSPCNDGLLCTTNDQCDAVGVCQGGANPCTPTPGDFDCSESCNAATGMCDAPDPIGSSCDDQQFCTATDTCDGLGACTGTGDPCEGADGDGNCAESCDEIANNCLANDPVGVACDDGLFCTANDTCSGLGACVGSGDPCPGTNDGDGDCAESCNEAAGDCTAPDLDGTACEDGSFCNGADTCSGGVCTSPMLDPCDGPDGDGDCSETCDNVVGACTGLDQNGTACDDGLACTGADQCTNGTCAGNPAANPCQPFILDQDCDCTESCAEDPLAASGFSCSAPNPAGTTCGPAGGSTGTCSATGACLNEGISCPSPLGVASLQPGDLVITEIMYNPSCVMGVTNDDCEWIEVYNATGATLNLNGLRVQDSALSGVFSWDTDVIVSPGGYAWLSTDDAGGWMYTNPPAAFVTGNFPGFNNSGTDSAAILTPTGTLIDQTATYTAVDLGDGRSWKLNPAATTAAANNVTTNWCYSTIVFDTVAGVDEFGSPGAANEVACAP